jgi:hypothetical protein
MHYITHDKDGPQKREIIWILEKIRRTVHVLYINNKKMKLEDLEGAIDQIAKYMSALIGSDPVKCTATNELRGVVKRAILKRRG